MSETITGNAVRDRMIADAILAARENEGEPINAANLGLRLPDDFQLDDSEVEAVLKAMEGGNDPPQPEAGCQPADTSQEAESVPSMAELQERLLTLNNDLSEARGDVLSLQSQLRDARGRLATAIAAFQNGFAPITREQLQREHIASEQARKARGEGLAARGQSMPGPSVVDRIAFFSKGGSINTGHGNAFRRGASTVRGRRVAVPSQG